MLTCPRGGAIVGILVWQSQVWEKSINHQNLLLVPSCSFESLPYPLILGAGVGNFCDRDHIKPDFKNFCKFNSLILLKIFQKPAQTAGFEISRLF